MGRWFESSRGRHVSSTCSEALRRFDREARLLASVNHPNVASIYGFARGPRSTADALDVMRQAPSSCAALRSTRARYLGDRMRALRIAERQTTVPGCPAIPLPPHMKGGSHLSVSQDESKIADVLNHKTTWISPVEPGEAQKFYEFDDPQVRIDYPVWSPDGTAIVFDRFKPEGGDIWLLGSRDPR